MVLFIVGFLEMIIATVWTRVVSRSQIAASAMVTFLNVITWYYVLQNVSEDMGNWQLVILYAFGCVLGTVVSIMYFDWRDKKETPQLLEESSISSGI